MNRRQEIIILSLGNLRGVTWVKINEVEGGNWAMGGQPLRAAKAQKMALG